jgi:tRNA threonylcarbamoyladenosine biosynthesis protein TsaE
MLIFDVENIQQLDEVANVMLAACNESKIFTFSGDLGSGKTTLIKVLCKKLGYDGDVTSPTFSLINDYPSIKNGRLYHMDLYRVMDMEEALDLGMEEYLYSGNFCFIEWPEIIESILDMGYYAVKITQGVIGVRKIEVTKVW